MKTTTRKPTSNDVEQLLNLGFELDEIAEDPDYRALLEEEGLISPSLNGGIL